MFAISMQLFINFNSPRNLCDGLLSDWVREEEAVGGNLGILPGFVVVAFLSPLLNYFTFSFQISLVRMFFLICGYFMSSAI